MTGLRLLFLSVLALATISKAEARTLNSYDVAGWVISAFSDDKTGRFDACFADAKYKSGVTLFFYVNTSFRWAFGLSGSKIRVSEGRTYDFIFQVDGGQMYDLKAVAASNSMAMIFLDDNAKIFQEMRRGRTLYTHVSGELTTFRLDGTARALVALLECVRSKGRPAPPPVAAQSTPADPPTSTAKRDTPDRGSISTGSGFFISSTGAGLTNAHVVEGCKTATISGYGPARIVARDVSNDLALVQVQSESKTPFARLRRKPLQLGETVYVMGFPLAGQLDNGLNFTSGLVSSLAGMGNDARFLQFTAPIQLGNSGGPIVDSGGLVVGVIQSKLSEIAALSASGSLPQNINFGIKSDLAANFVRANGGEPIEVESASPQEATAVAKDGRGYTFQIKCQVE